MLLAAGCCSETLDEVPSSLSFMAESWGLHATIVLLTVRVVALPRVALRDRLLLAPLDAAHGVYRAVLRSGYQDEVKLVGCTPRRRMHGICVSDGAYPACLCKARRPVNVTPPACTYTCCRLLACRYVRALAAQGDPPIQACMHAWLLRVCMCVGADDG